MKNKIPKWINVEDLRYFIKVGKRGKPHDIGFFANKKDARRVYEWLVEQYKKDKKPIDFTKPRNIGRTLPRPSFIRALEFLADEPRNVRKQTA